jgi:hypothetical protein
VATRWRVEVEGRKNVEPKDVGTFSKTLTNIFTKMVMNIFWKMLDSTFLST